MTAFVPRLNDGLVLIALIKSVLVCFDGIQYLVTCAVESLALSPFCLFYESTYYFF